MGTLAIIAVSVLYSIIAMDYFWFRKEPGMGLVFLGYVVANMGFIFHNHYNH